MKNRFQQGRVPRVSLRILPLTWMTGVAAWLLPTTQSPAQSQVIPTGAGAGTQVIETGDQYDIEGGTQAGGNLFHEFDEFSLTAAETANFVSDSGIFNIVGQVSAANPSYIDGTVQVSGSDANLYLVNPAGVLFGPDAQVSLSGSFSVTTADQIEFDGTVLNVLDSGADYSTFTGDPSAFHFTETSVSAVVNQGDVTVAPGESISLIGGNVVNTGSLRAPGGEIALVAVDGESTVRYGIPGSLLSLELTEGAVPNGAGFAVTDLPALLTGSSTPLVDELTLRSDGIYELGSLQIGTEEVSVAGEISTRATVGDGGEIALLGRSVDAVDAVIDASGDNGGNIRIGKDVGSGALPTSVLVWLYPTSVVRADGLAGAGGDIAVGSTRRARVQGDISAQGETLGGLVETSSSNLNSINLRVNASGQAENGRWLVAPGDDIDIVSGATDFNQINPSVIESTLDSGTNIEITTTLAPGGAGDILLSDSIAQNGGGNANLTLTGQRFINNGSTIDLSSTGQLTFEINQVNAESNPDSNSIESAISAIGNVNGDRLINLGAGTYDFSGALDVNTQVEIQGADVDTTMLQDTSGDRIFNVLSSGDLQLQDVTLTKTPAGAGMGGGILNSGGSLAIIDSHLRDNVAPSGGAISAVDGANLTVISSEFEGNQASSSSGGAIFLENSTASIGSGLDGPTVFMANMATDAAGAIQIIDSSTVVQGTLFEANRSEGDGGAVSIRSSLPVQFEQVTFESNKSQGNGGAVALGGQSEVSLADTILFNNQADGSGGAVFAGGSTLDIINSLLDGNTADAGGGLQVRETSSLMVEGSRFTNNTAIVGEGGGIFIDNSDATLQSVKVSDNTATVQGGGVAQRSGTLVINESDIHRNGTDGNGGGLLVEGNDANLQLSNTTLESNRAVDGGGLFNRSVAELTNTTFSNNVATNEGGGIKNTGANAILTAQNSTIYENEAGQGGGILSSDLAQTARVLNTIVAGNVVTGNVSTVGHDVSGHFIDQGNNLIGRHEGATGFTNSVWVGSAAKPIDPRLAPLADNGGPTRTHAPLVNSVAIDAGSDVNLPAVDQRGLLRVAGNAVDIGAVELSATELANTVPMPNPSESTGLTSGLLDPTVLTTGASDLDALLSMRKRYELDDADAAIRLLEQSFSQGFEDYWDLSSGSYLTFSEVQAILRRAQDEYKVNSAVVYAIFAPEEPSEAKADTILQVESTSAGDDLLNLSVVMPEGELVSYQLPVTRNEVVRQVRYFRSTVSDPNDARGYQPLAQQLYQWLLAPLEADLAAQNVQNLMYALDTGLRTAPIAAMRDYEGFSLERYGLSVVPSMGLMQADFPVSVRRSTVAMGVSEFTSESPLPAVPIELQVVDQFVPVSQTLLNEATTLDAIKSIQMLDQPGILHLATHANFDRRSPEESYIHLWNGPLNMREFSQLDWAESDLEMLVLSACSTALGSRNSELGFAGLAAASGVDATVGSLWEVSDVGTLALMSEFYAQLEETDVRFEALRQAQLALLKRETRIEGGNLITGHGEVNLPAEWNLPESATLDHPFFWSAFTMVGNPW